MLRDQCGQYLLCGGDLVPGHMEVFLRGTRKSADSMSACSLCKDLHLILLLQVFVVHTLCYFVSWTLVSPV